MMVTVVRVKQEAEYDASFQDSRAVLSERAEASRARSGSLQPSAGAASKIMASLPPDAASSAVFPPGCIVMYPHDNLGIDDNEEAVVEFGTVESISIDIAPGSSRELLHTIKTSGESNLTKVVGETRLRYAPQCPVSIRNEGIVATKRAHETLDGVILYGTFRISEYSVLVQLDEHRHVMKHGVASERIKFRPTKLSTSYLLPSLPCTPIDTSSACKPPEETRKTILLKAATNRDLTSRPDAERTDQENPTKKLKWTPPASSASQTKQVESPPRNQRSAPQETDAQSGRKSLSLDSSVVISARPQTSRINTVAGNIGYVNSDDQSGRTFSRRVEIPAWLAGREIVEHLLGKGGQKIKALRGSSGCQISLRGRWSGCGDKRFAKDETHIVISGTDFSSVNQTKITIENWLIKFVGDDSSLGRLLYEIADMDNKLRKRGRKQSVRDTESATVLQRSPYDLTQRVWMNLVELPSKKGEYHGKFLVGPKGCLVREIKRTYTCDMDIYGVFDDCDILCDPYVIITASERKSVDNAVAMVESKIHNHMSKCHCSWSIAYDLAVNHEI